MLDLNRYIGFEWDKSNIDKSYQKHGITSKEAEEVFLDKDLQLAVDVIHSKIEKRHTILGKTIAERILFVVFTIRKNKVRIISARKASFKERGKYAEKIKKNS